MASTPLCAHPAVGFSIFKLHPKRGIAHAGESSSNARGENQKGNRRDLPDQRLGGGAVGGSRPPVTGCPVLRGLEHRVIGAPETQSTAYRAEQYEPQKVFLEEIAGAGAVALKAAAMLTSKLTGSHI
jgi:hypothetical protein